jgi:hypothetical protein
MGLLLACMLRLTALLMQAQAAGLSGAHTYTHKDTEVATSWHAMLLTCGLGTCCCSSRNCARAAPRQHPSLILGSGEW